ncbi:hypothetical protein D022_2984A, partial [Vibrio parahaemolyticus 12310]
MARVALDSYSA